MKATRSATSRRRDDRRFLSATGGASAILCAAVLAAGCIRFGHSTPSGPAHPADAVEFGGHWYKAFEGRVPWHEAKTLCEKAGGYLACIESPAEQAFVAKLAQGRYLSLGASDEKSEGRWTWVNGAPFKYECWLDGQPNNYGGDENYLATYDGGAWVDVASEGDGFWMPIGYICEWEK